MSDNFPSPPQRNQPYCDGHRDPWATETDREERRWVRPYPPLQWSPGRSLAPENTQDRALVHRRRTPVYNHNDRKRAAPSPERSHPRKIDNRRSTPSDRLDRCNFARVDGNRRSRSPVRPPRQPSPRRPRAPDTWDHIDKIVDGLPEDKAWALLEFLEKANKDDWADLGRPRRDNSPIIRCNGAGVTVENTAGGTININNNST
ncbi:hypothetical protein K458DRAFT_397585 [Lentithecium fluviatile CBS 122367]|uniref:Uncharacterized protein n=1 Tax=Lentithecium fluviatile CBS 122367 TaxID=1168545 RepID=A0A6G1IC83_9PLEO|nr:hypothetical protein K458DRAFT_397585 [Lentithecium fluviatile CBS 122367]